MKVHKKININTEEMEIKENKKFAKVNMRDVIKHKIKWVFKILWLCLNYPFDKLLAWM